MAQKFLLKWTALVLGLTLCAIPMALVAHQLLGSSAAAYLNLYPLAFLFAFRGRPQHRLPPELLLLPGTVLAVAGAYFSRMSLVWAGSFWNALALCHAYGIAFSFPAPLLICAVPPVSGFFSLLAGYRLRLTLTDLAGSILRLVDQTVVTSGNLLLWNDHWFTVERVCEGMKMALAAFLLALICVRRSRLSGQILILALVFPLWLLANLARIVLLIWFNVAPTAPGHELIGMALFAGVVAFPMLAISALVPTPAPHNKEGPGQESKWPLVRTALCLLYPVVAITAFFVADHNRAFRVPAERQWPDHVERFALEAASIETDPRIAVYHDRGRTLIIKRDMFAAGTGHDPHICFEAVGFSFLEEGIENIGGMSVRSARVRNVRTARLFWWYSWNGQVSVSDWDWRIAKLRGSEITQWNLYGEDDEALRQAVAGMLYVNATGAHP